MFALENWSALNDEAPRDEDGEPLGFLNVGTGSDLSINKLAEQIANVVNYRGLIHWNHKKPDGTPKKQLDISRLSAMGWKAQIELKEGLPMAYRDFLNQLETGTLRE